MVSTNMFANRIANLRESLSFKINHEVRKLTTQGIKIINFSIGEPGLSTPQEAQLAAIEAIHLDNNRYPPLGGLPTFKQAVIERMRSRYQLEVESQHIGIANGSKQIIFNSLLATLNEGDEVICIAPFWNSYPEIIQIFGGKVITVNSLQAVASAITPQTKWIFINSPRNPDGYVYTPEELLELAAVVDKYPHIFVLSDEVYDEIIFGDNLKLYNLLTLAPHLQQRVLSINSVSKSFSMTGWRVGYSICFNAELNMLLQSILSQSTSGINFVAQAASSAAIRCKSYTQFRSYCQAKRDLMLQLLAPVPEPILAPKGGLYVFLDATHWITALKCQDDEELADVLLHKYHLAVMPGKSSGVSNYIRLCFALDDEELIEGCTRLINIS